MQTSAARTKWGPANSSWISCGSITSRICGNLFDCVVVKTDLETIGCVTTGKPASARSAPDNWNNEWSGGPDSFVWAP